MREDKGLKIMIFFKYTDAVEMNFAGKINKFKIVNGDVWSQHSIDSKTNVVKIDVYKSNLAEQAASGGKPIRLSISKPSFEKLKIKSEKVAYLVENDVLSEDNKEELKLKEWEKVANLGFEWIRDFVSQLKGKSLSANCTELAKEIQLFNKNINYLLGDDADLLNADKKTKAMIQFLQTKKKMTLNAPDHKIRDGAFVYIPSLEKVVLELFNEAHGGWDMDDARMMSASLSDGLSILKVSKYIHQGKFLQAYQNCSMDTLVRERLPRKFWDSFAQSDVAGLKKITAISKKALEDYEAKNAVVVSTPQVRKPKI